MLQERRPVVAPAAIAIVLAIGLSTTARAAPLYEVVHSFAGLDGSGPWSGVTFDARGNLYGTTASGGTAGGCDGYGCGVVFELRPQRRGAWGETVLHSFGIGGDGSVPYGGVVVDGSGNVFGTTTFGGTYNHGIAFELGSSGWPETVLYSFCAKTRCKDGSSPEGDLTLDARDDVYGTGGIVYELARGSNGWKEVVLHAFAPNGRDGLGPRAAVISDASGHLYGTTEYGGIRCGSTGCGTVYELTPLPQGGWTENVLHRFVNNGIDGFTPGWGALFMDRTGSLYGTTAGGGCCVGVVFKLTPDSHGRWKETILHEFTGGSGGYEPNAGVIMDKAGNLYGTTGLGGTVGCGVIYRLAPDGSDTWTYTILHSFQSIDGCLPEGNLVLDKTGALYGGAVFGGTNGNNGVIFRLSP